MIKVLIGILNSVIGNVGINSAKLKDAIWNTFARGFEVSYEEDEGKKIFTVSDRVVGEYDGAVDAGLGEIYDGPAIRKVILTAAESLWNALYKD